MEYLVAGLSMIALGAVLIWNPLFFWERTRHSGSREPSKGRILYTRIIAVVAVLVGIIDLLGPLLIQI